MSMNAVLVAINELNLELLRFYIERQPSRYPVFCSLLKADVVTTFAEDRHEINEPWIAWPSFFLGCSNDKHKIFELRMRAKTDSIDLFSEIASRKISCSSFFNMNVNVAEHPDFIRVIPSPWEEIDPCLKTTKFDSRLHELVRRLVLMNNTGKIDKGLFLDGMFWKFLSFSIKNLSLYPKIFEAMIKNTFKPLMPAVFDLLVFRFLVGNIDFEDIKFNSFFFNGLAHVQHHFFNRSLYAGDSQSDGGDGRMSDPFPLIFDIYELLLKEIHEKFACGLVMSGFEQRKYQGESIYYTISNLASFSEILGVEQAALKRLMSRDFCYESQSEEVKAELEFLQQKLSGFKIKSTGQKIFKFEEYGAQLIAWVDVLISVDHETAVEFFDLTFKWGEIFTKNAVKQGTHMGVGWASGFGGFFEAPDEKNMRLWELRRKVSQEVLARFA